MIDEIRTRLGNCKNEFENNVQDSFGQNIRQDIYEPFEAELASVDQAMEESKNEQQMIKNLLTALRTIV